MKSPALLPIKLPVSAKDKRLSVKSSYLINYEDNWYAGKFVKEWYGWVFDSCYDAGIQIDYPGWKAVFEIKET
jgi:hypothetical protein